MGLLSTVLVTTGGRGPYSSLLCIHSDWREGVLILTFSLECPHWRPLTTVGLPAGGIRPMVLGGSVGDVLL